MASLAVMFSRELWLYSAHPTAADLFAVRTKLWQGCCAVWSCGLCLLPAAVATAILFFIGRGFGFFFVFLVIPPSPLFYGIDCKHCCPYFGLLGSAGWDRGWNQERDWSSGEQWFSTWPLSYCYSFPLLKRGVSVFARQLNKYCLIH